MHGYFGTDIGIVREVVERQIPMLERQVRAILEELE